MSGIPPHPLCPPPTPPQPSDPPPEEEEPGKAQAAGALATLAPLVRTQHHLPNKMLPDPDFSTLLQRTLGQLSHGASQWAVGSGTV